MPREGWKCTRSAEVAEVHKVCPGVNVSDKFLQEAALDRNTKGGP